MVAAMHQAALERQRGVLRHMLERSRTSALASISPSSAGSTHATARGPNGSDREPVAAELIGGRRIRLTSASSSRRSSDQQNLPGDAAALERGLEAS